MSGARVGVRTLAEGRPGAPLVVLAHGLEAGWTSWRKLASHLDPDWRVEALDLPWRPGNDYSWQDRRPGQWVAAGIDLVGAVPDLLVAHSFSASATLELLSEVDPRTGRAVALLAPQYRIPDRRVSWRMFDRSRRTFVRHIREGVLAGLGERAHTVDPAVLEGMVDIAIERVGPTGFLSVFQQFAASGDLPLGHVRTPTLLLVGGEDPTLTPAAAAVLADALPNARLLAHDDYDHFCHIRHAGAVAAQVSGLLTDARYAVPGVPATPTPAGERR